MSLPRARHQTFIINGKRIVFPPAAMLHLRKNQKSVWQGLAKCPWPVLAVAPVVYAAIIPVLILDAFISAYQAICFPVLGIAKVRRIDFISLDRGQLPYLNWVERFNCDYCAYFNGVVAFSRELASLTEQYFCPIRHALAPRGMNERSKDFLPYGDGKDYHARQKLMQAKLKSPC